VVGPTMLALAASGPETIGHRGSLSYAACTATELLAGSGGLDAGP
jgi:hypothetical protein